jgi:uncharacterized membrane-anchored protein YjiN (DUF445 family)
MRKKKAPVDPEKPKEKRNLRQKEIEYPNINWSNLEDPDVQKATILYNDRINTFREMLLLDQTIDQEPTKESVRRLAELRIRNLLCFKELKTYNDTKKFVLEHPLIRQFSLRAELEQMLTRNPDLFLEEYRNVANNVSRYRSYLNGDKSDKKKVDSWKTRLKEHQERENLMKDILNESRHE